MVNKKDADRCRIWRKPAMIVATLAMAITLAATARADDSVFNNLRFQSPSGDIICVIQRNHDLNDPANYGEGSGTCQVFNPNYPPPPRQYVGADGRPSTCYLNGWGSQISLPEGSEPHLDCIGGILVEPPPPLPIVDVGESMTLASITCTSEPLAMRCTDTSTGHFFRISRDSYELS